MESEMLPLEDAVKFTEKLASENCQILGIERFICNDRSAMPDLNAIADFSSLETGNVVLSLHSAREYFAQFGKDEKEVFTVVYQLF